MVVAAQKKPPQPLTLTLPAAASDEVTLPRAMTAAWAEPTDSPPEPLGSTAAASCAPPVTETGPVLATDTAPPITVPDIAAACPWKVVEALVVLNPPNVMICACCWLASRQHKRAANRPAETGRETQRRFTLIVFIVVFILHIRFRSWL